jgi:hypothetical protein
MAAQLDTEKQVVTHREGYERFIGVFKWGAVACFIVAMCVVFIIAK